MHFTEPRRSLRLTPPPSYLQNILLNVAVLAENGRQLLDAKMPEVREEC
jgi:hypothetical protein